MSDREYMLSLALHFDDQSSEMHVFVLTPDGAAQNTLLPAWTRQMPGLDTTANMDNVWLRDVLIRLVEHL